MNSILAKGYKVVTAMLLWKKRFYPHAQTFKGITII